MKKIIFITLLILLNMLITQANTEQTLNEANMAYAAENYEQAKELYLKIINQDYIAADLYYNLGNTYYKLNQIPNAILYYEKAAKLAPNDPDIAYNLKIASMKTIDKIEAIPPLFFVKYWQSLVSKYNSSTWAIIVICLFAITLFSILGIFYLKTKHFKRILLYTSLLFALFTITTVIISTQQYNKEKTHNTAIVFTPSINIKSSPNINGNDLFVLHEGTKLFIEKELNNWCQIRLANGNKGWIQKKNIVLI